MRTSRPGLSENDHSVRSRDIIFPWNIFILFLEQNMHKLEKARNSVPTSKGTFIFAGNFFANLNVVI